MEEESERESVASISQEIMRHAQRTETDEVIQIVFVSIFINFRFWLTFLCLYSSTQRVT